MGVHRAIGHNRGDHGCYRRIREYPLCVLCSEFNKRAWHSSSKVSRPCESRATSKKSAVSKLVLGMHTTIRADVGICSRWFGLILLPVVSFSADGVVAIVYFTRSIFNHLIGKETLVPSSLAKGRAIDLSIQFVLFWMPFLVLLGWWIDKPMHLLFGEWLDQPCSAIVDRADYDDARVNRLL